MMTAAAKARDWCCPGHNPKELDHGVSRARETRDWRREADSDRSDPAPDDPGRS